MIKGFATPAGTQRFAQKHEGLAFNKFGPTELTTCQAGFGSYRVSNQSDQHRTALFSALQSGINLIDTSSNYGDGGSERLIGQVVDDLIHQGELQRNELIIVSKAGYLQGQNLILSQERKDAGNPFPDLIEYMQGLEHCIHPEFLADQLTRTLERLDMETLDIYLLHNPEYYLSWAARSGIELVAARAEYYRRLELALVHLESEVTTGRIRGYGISSNSFPSPADDPEFTDLSRVLQIVADNDLKHFVCIQLPGNVMETGLVAEQNQPDNKSVLQLAAAHNLAVLVNRPLNAIIGNSLVRLATLPATTPPNELDVSTAVDNLAQREMLFESELMPSLLLSVQEKERVPALVATGKILQQRWSAFGNWHQWQDVQYSVLIPRLRAVAEMLLKRRNLPAEAREWLEGYGHQAELVLALVGQHYQSKSAEQSQIVHQALQQADPAWAAPTLSQSALRALRSTTGVTSVLVGTRQTAYVSDVVRELYRPVEKGERVESWRKMAEVGKAGFAGSGQEGK